jgi:biotin transport system substrate-specific component
VAIEAKNMTLLDAALAGRYHRMKDVFLIAGFAILMPLLAGVAISLPFTPVPVTGQTFGVLLAGALLGPRRGAMAMLVYLAEGLVGLPVFAGGANAWSPSLLGVPVIIGPSAGYLFSFPVAAFVVGRLAQRGWDRRFWRAVTMMIVGHVLIYLFGLSWLGTYVGMERAVPLGLLPFVPGDVLKVLLAATLLPSAWHLLGVKNDH